MLSLFSAIKMDWVNVELLLLVFIEFAVEMFVCALKIVFCVCFTISNALSHAALCVNALLMFIRGYLSMPMALRK